MTLDTRPLQGAWVLQGAEPEWEKAAGLGLKRVYHDVRLEYQPALAVSHVRAKSVNAVPAPLHFDIKGVSERKVSEMHRASKRYTMSALPSAPSKPSSRGARQGPCVHRVPASSHCKWGCDD